MMTAGTLAVQRQYVGSVLLLLVALILAILLGGCAQLQKQGQQGQQVLSGQRLALGYTINAQVREQAASMLKEKRISVNAAKQIQAFCDLARQGLDTATELFFAGKDKEALTAVEKAEQLNAQAQTVRTDALERKQ